MRRGLSTQAAVLGTVAVLVIGGLTVLYLPAPGLHNQSKATTVTSTDNPTFTVLVTGSSTITTTTTTYVTAVVTTTTTYAPVVVTIQVLSQQYHDVLVGVVVTAAASPYLKSPVNATSDNNGDVTFTFTVDQVVQEQFTSSDSGHYPGSVTVTMSPTGGSLNGTIYEQCRSFNAVC